ncbi:hypothetical protein BD626DRAFT_510793 [Schizophyllum amplum]|uniref:Uncharacterized protein n=1 Tax=Schizophyllum amplum TaxID=97359 RepID=A0A550C1B9_9AGAR|nr:hypothetical protein BD626DRAFT_510793 [Auriculariopsis ampla]
MAVPDHLLQRAIERLTQTARAEGIPTSASIDVLLGDDWSTTVSDVGVAAYAHCSGLAILQRSLFDYVVHPPAIKSNRQFGVAIVAAPRRLTDSESLAYIAHGWVRQGDVWNPSDRVMRRSYTKRMGVLARNLHELFREKYDVVIDQVFIPLLQEYVSFQLQNPAPPVKRPLAALQEVGDDDDGQGENNRDNEAAGPSSKRLRTHANASASDDTVNVQNNITLENLASGDNSFTRLRRHAAEDRQLPVDLENADVQRQIGMMRREHPRAGSVVNAFLAIPNLMKDGRAKLSGILREYVIPYATDRRFLLAVMLCLGAALYRTQPAWVAMLQDSFHLARETVLSPGRANADAQMLRSLEAAAQEATPDLDQIRHLIGSIKCEGTASSALAYYFHLQGRLPNSEFYYGLGKAALCGIFTSLKIVEPLA